MRKLAYTLGILAIASGILVMVSRAPETVALQGSSSPGSAQLMMIAGEIATVNAIANSITLRTGASAAQEFSVDRGAEITDGARDLDLRDLKPGDRVTIGYVEQAGKRTAKEITLQQGSSPSPSSMDESEADSPNEQGDSNLLPGSQDERTPVGADPNAGTSSWETQGTRTQTPSMMQREEENL
jgi:hypothetical protein